MLLMPPAQRMHQEGPVRELRDRFHAVLRGFGVLDANRTPCGQPLHLSLAHGLMELLARPGLRQGDLGEALGLSKSAASRLVSQMERRAWVERLVDEHDGRVWHVSLTAKGQRTAAQVEAASLKRFSAVLQCIAESERSGVSNALLVLAQAMANSGLESPP